MFLPAGKAYKVEYSCSEFIVVHLPSCNYTEAEIIQVGDFTAIAALFARLLEGWKTNHSANQAKAYVYEILHRLSEKRSDPEPVPNPEMEKCAQYIRDHLQESDLSVDAVCRHAYVSRSSLQRYFLHRFGTSPKQYILKLRMELAMELLAHNGRTIAEVAAACGFPDEKYFSRIFRKSYGISPSQLRSRTLI